ncbi:hypothetical protein [Kosmotoga sp. DU53]|uniref:AbiU2 domain-containing protein n=1 Tax=Kosmotoga sp. DU53 TaxID=1310160 RepID=UPI0007C568B4|nr:hypothetical protein [Kosmotoga sp. DU53]OAA23058.1 hypothetical protein DU53_03320 [Kosmotoga sp. DU53]
MGQRKYAISDFKKEDVPNKLYPWTREYFKKLVDIIDWNLVYLSNLTTIVDRIFILQPFDRFQSATTSFYWHLTLNVYIDQEIFMISRLFDRESMEKNINISLYSMVQFVEIHVQTSQAAQIEEILEKLRGHIKKLSKEYEDIRKYRNKVLAHLDMKEIFRRRSIPLVDLEELKNLHHMIKKLLPELIEVLNIFRGKNASMIYGLTISNCRGTNSSNKCLIDVLLEATYQFDGEVGKDLKK